MPDRALNDDGTVVDLDSPPPGEPAVYDPAAIAACTLCDSTGYRGRVVCDHKTHENATGRAAMQAELDKIRHRQVARAKQPYRTEEGETP